MIRCCWCCLLCGGCFNVFGTVTFRCCQCCWYCEDYTDFAIVDDKYDSDVGVVIGVGAMVMHHLSTKLLFLLFFRC